jgi:hypothetical protein
MPIKDKTLLERYPGKTLAEAKKLYFGGRGRRGGLAQVPKGFSMNLELAKEASKMSRIVRRKT